MSPIYALLSVIRQQMSPFDPFRGGAQWLRIGVQEDIFVFDHIPHFDQYKMLQLG